MPTPTTSSGETPLSFRTAGTARLSTFR